MAQPKPLLVYTLVTCLSLLLGAPARAMDGVSCTESQWPAGSHTSGSSSYYFEFLTANGKKVTIYEGSASACRKRGAAIQPGVRKLCTCEPGLSNSIFLMIPDTRYNMKCYSLSSDGELLKTEAVRSFSAALPREACEEAARDTEAGRGFTPVRSSELEEQPGQTGGASAI